MIGVRASVAMGDTRSIRVFVMGEANRPGQLHRQRPRAPSPRRCMPPAGIKPFGSLRDIQLKRAGAVVRRLDLYDLLLRGDTSDDAKLLPGDVIFIPPVASTVAVDGEVHRPAIYEIKGRRPVADIVRAGRRHDARGGSQPRRAGSGERCRASRRGRCAARSASRARASCCATAIQLRVLRLRPTLDQGVTVEGHVFRPAPGGLA